MLGEPETPRLPNKKREMQDSAAQQLAEAGKRLATAVQQKKWTYARKLAANYLEAWKPLVCAKPAYTRGMIPPTGQEISRSFRTSIPTCLVRRKGVALLSETTAGLELPVCANPAVAKNRM